MMKKYKQFIYNQGTSEIVTNCILPLWQPGIIPTHPITSLPRAVLKNKEHGIEVPWMFLAIHMEISLWCEQRAYQKWAKKKCFLMYLLSWKSKLWFNSQEEYYKFALHTEPFAYICLGWWHCSWDLGTPAKMSVHRFMLSQTTLAVIIPLSGTNPAVMWVRGHNIAKPSLCRLISQCKSRISALDYWWTSLEVSRKLRQNENAWVFYTIFIGMSF